MSCRILGGTFFLRIFVNRVSVYEVQSVLLIMKMEVFFRDVSLGEEFEFNMQVLSAKAVKAKLATVLFADGQSLLSNLIIIKITPTMQNCLNRKPGDYEWLPDNGIVLVDRPLPSGS